MVTHPPADGERGAVRGYQWQYAVAGHLDTQLVALAKLFDVDAGFDDQDHEWYETGEDPHELVNLSNDRGRRNELRGLFRRLLDYEAEELTLTP